MFKERNFDKILRDDIPYKIEYYEEKNSKIQPLIQEFGKQLSHTSLYGTL